MMNNETIEDNCSHVPKTSSSTTVMIESFSYLSTNDDIKANKELLKHPVQFTAEDLRTHLEPIISKMIAWEESYQFRQPVDPVALNIPDYPTIIKHPMDLSTMHNKLFRGEYKNPSEFCDDAWLMFNNAWLYNKKTLRIYRTCIKLAELFVELTDPVVQALGYCCACQYIYSPKDMLCYGKEQCCKISCDANYYYYNNCEPSRFNLSNDKYTFCDRCFNSIKNESVFIGDDLTETLVEIPKTLFLSAKNNIPEFEILIDCIVCTRRWHQTCALHFDQIWSEGFICNTCIRQHNLKRKENCYTAQKLTITHLSSQLEQRVNQFLLDKDSHEGPVIIRVLNSHDKICQVKPLLKKYYQNQVGNNDGYPYHSKAVFAFQQIDGVDVFFFGMYVQEYDEHCPAPNTRRVYISCFDTVHFFQPKLYRRDVYHQILIGYLDYAKQNGYMYAHIWARLASEGIDYIFHNHPWEQRFLKPKRLQDWCKNMLDRAILERVVIDYKDIMKDSLDNQVQIVLDIPYFDNDFWPTMIEETIEKLYQEEENRRKQEVEAARSMEDEDLYDPIEPEDSTEISGKRKSANTYERKNSKKTANQQILTKNHDLLSIIFSTMEKYKEAFFVIRLQNQIRSCPAVNDTNAPIQCDLIDTPNAFLSFSYDKNYEFSSLRGAKFSTMALLYEIHTSTIETFCEDFDLCDKFDNMELKHEHKIECLPSSRAVINQNDESIVSTQLQRQQSMQRSIEIFLHAFNCSTVNCVNDGCFRYKRIIQHTKDCKEKNPQCNICKQVSCLCSYHAKSCVDQNCQVPFCNNWKCKIKNQRVTSLQTDQHRMDAMMM